MLGQLRDKTAGKKRPTASLPSGRKSSKFARLATFPVTPAATLPAAPSSAEPAAAESKHHHSRSGARAPAPPVPPVAPVLHLREALRRGSEEGDLMPMPLPDVDACRPFAFASEEEISASRWLPVISPRPRTAAFGAAPLVCPSSDTELSSRVFAQLADGDLGACELQPPSGELLALDAVLGNRPNPQPHVVRMPLKHSLAQIREELAADSLVSDKAASALASAMAAKRAAPNAWAGIAEEEGACMRDAAEASDCAGGYAARSLGFELEPAVSSTLLPSPADDTGSSFVDVEPLALYRPLASTAGQRFAFCEMDSRARSARSSELAGACLAAHHEPAGGGAQLRSGSESRQSQPDHARGRGTPLLLASSTSLGQFALSRIAHARSGPASDAMDEAPTAGFDESSCGELMPQFTATVILVGLSEPAETLALKAHALRAPAARLGTDRSLGDAWRAMDAWMYDEVGEERLRALDPPDTSALQLRDMYDVARTQHALGGARTSRLASSAQALDAARQRLLGFPPAEKPDASRSAPSAICPAAISAATASFIERLLLAERAGQPQAASALELPAEAEPLAPAEAPPLDGLPPAEGGSAGSARAAAAMVDDWAAVPMKVSGGALACPTPAIVADDEPRPAPRGAHATPAPDANRSGPPTAQPRSANALPRAATGSTAAAAAHPASSLVDQQEDMINNFMLLRQKGLLPAAPAARSHAPAASAGPAAAGRDGLGSSGDGGGQLEERSQRIDVLASPLPSHPQHGGRLQLCVGERARTYHAPALVGLASRGVTWCDRGFWTPCLAMSSGGAAVFVDSADLLEPGGAADVLEELHVLAATYTRCWLLVDDRSGLASAAHVGAPEALLHALSQVVTAAHSISLRAIASVYGCQAELCDQLSCIVQLECAADAAGASSPLPFAPLESTAEQLLTCFFNPIASIRVLAAPRWERGCELASFLRLTPEQRVELFPWLHPVGLAALANVTTRATNALPPRDDLLRSPAWYGAALATDQLQNAGDGGLPAGFASCADQGGPECGGFAFGSGWQ